MKNKISKFNKQFISMVLVTILVQVLVLLRVFVVANKYGISEQVDFFNFINTIAMVLFSFINVGISAVIMPRFSQDNKEKDISIFLTIVYGVATIILVISIILSSIIINTIFAKTFGSYEKIIINALLVSQYIISYTGVTNAILNFKDKFNIPKISMLISNFFIVVFLIIDDKKNIVNYAVLILVAAIINLAIQVYFSFKCKIRLKISLKVKSREVKSMLQSFLPTVVSAGLYQISILVDTIIAGGLGTGNISILNYSNYIISMVNVIFIANISTFLYPKIIKKVQTKEIQQDISNYILIINMILMLLMSIIIVCGEELIGILYSSNMFNIEIIKMIYWCTCLYAIAIPINSMRDIIYKYFYANKDTYTPFKNSLIISCINILLSIILSKVIGIYGVVLGTTLTSIMSLLFIYIKLKRKYRIHFNLKDFLLENLKNVVATILSIIIVLIAKDNFEIFPSIINILISSLMVLIIYIGSLSLMKSKIFNLNSKIRKRYIF